MRSVSILLIAITVAVAGTLWVRLESTPPRVETLEGPIPVGENYVHEVRISDPESGVESVRVWIDTPAGERVLYEQRYPGNLLLGADSELEQLISFPVPPRELGIPDGPASLQIEVTDYSLRGNRSTQEVALSIDTRPPRVALLTGLTYIRRGGAEAAVYGVDELVEIDGIQIGESLHPGFSHPEREDLRIAFYALSPDPESPSPEVVAIDPAGNETRVPLSLGIIERGFPTDRIELSEAFMQRKVAELGASGEGTPAARYLELNRGLRERSHEKLREISVNSSADRLWEGRFAQLPNSKVVAIFGEQRSYVYDGEAIDSQLHQGYDLASIAHAKVPAANHGVVAFAGPLGIYGNTVVIDHGLGLASLYGHLSEITVESGRAVRKGDSLGRTGQTGLAGGDHLHFAMLVNGEFVDPLEWFDPKWLREHIEPKLVTEPAGEAAAGAGA